MNDNAHDNSTQIHPDGDRAVHHNAHVAMSSRLDAQAQNRFATARRGRTLAHAAIAFVALLLGLLAAPALKPYVGESFLVAYLVSVVVHLAMGFGIEAVIFGRATGNAAGVGFGALMVAASVAVLIGVAAARAHGMIENGQPVAVAILLSAVIALFEMGLPALAGFFAAQKGEIARRTGSDAGFYKELHQNLNTVPDDAQGLWTDQEEELAEDIRDRKVESIGTGPEKREIAILEDRLRTLRKANPRSRYSQRDQIGNADTKAGADTAFGNGNAKSASMQ